MSSNLWDAALFEMRRPIEDRRPSPRPSSRTTWSRRAVENLEDALQADDTRQRLVSIIWRCMRGELMDLLVRTTFQEVKAMIAKERLTMLRRDVAGFKVYDLDCLDADFRKRLGDLVWDLVSEDVLDAIDIKTSGKKTSKKKR